ncbi:DNA gyrase inhibitor YacG [Kaistia algarum]|jgi:hypothetical protein|uniref:DNA gyrase inhibitor YacG n=1 Tax=Kaistia algarum TaxID=2083279 RepID=UPI000CE92648|nr:DNA gyrase inhibitor YacG [Kaistia algarum]MCX5513309.1 DNA gyrase inhibitor YacG [Kaistia algarum]PPE81238.1 DNA gyrase inhibitor YacG [Kaistia algarum]
MTDRTSDTPPKRAEIVPLRPPRPCPICSQESTRAAYPFCSKRCKDLDLHRWFSGAYAIPAVEADSEDDEAEG